MVVQGEKKEESVLNPEKCVFVVFIGKLRLNPSTLLFALTTLQLTQLTSSKTLELLMITFMD